MRLINFKEEHARDPTAPFPDIIIPDDLFTDSSDLWDSPYLVGLCKDLFLTPL